MAIKLRLAGLHPTVQHACEHTRSTRADCRGRPSHCHTVGSHAAQWTHHLVRSESWPSPLPASSYIQLTVSVPCILRVDRHARNSARAFLTTVRTRLARTSLARSAHAPRPRPPSSTLPLRRSRTRFRTATCLPAGRHGAMYGRIVAASSSRTVEVRARSPTPPVRAAPKRPRSSRISRPMTA